MEQEEGESESDQVEERAVGNHLPEAEHSGGGDCGERSYAVDFSLSTCSQINSRWFLFKFATWQLVCIYQCGLSHPHSFFFSNHPSHPFFSEPVMTVYFAIFIGHHLPFFSNKIHSAFFLQKEQ
jgi:hypothetical protein